ncbi:MAG TPA: PPK2 family polyphosphate kinase [Bradyrhizobium sp.]|nr:PPK2 family polyphosphate kinase [Bradyrhizobium sp.]
MAQKNSPDAGLLVEPGSDVRLGDIDPRAMPADLSKDAAKQRTKEDALAIDEMQDRLYAEGRRALLIVLQGVDTSGKDGTIRAVFNASGPPGIRVTSFRGPSADELAHDYLWRVHQHVPPKGIIGIFNRSHYEDVLIVKVKNLVPPDVIEKRYDQINHFEKHLVENDISILKFMLHISSEEQKERLTERLEDPKKQWKFNPSDLEDRKLWKDYEEAYEIALGRCSTKWAPWHVIPADRNWVRNAEIARIVRRKLEEMNPQYPKPEWNPADFKIV